MTQYDVIVVGAGNAALAAAVSAKENGAECVVVLEKAPREMRGGNTHWSGGVLRFAFDDPREIGPLLPGVEDETEDFYDGIQPYTFDDFHGDLMRVTSGQTDPVLSRILVQNSKDTVFWMNRVGNIRMEPATSLTGVRKGNKIIWARGLVVRAAHEGVGLSRGWFATAEKMGIEIRYGAAVTAILQDDRGHASGVHVRDDDGVADVHGRAVILGCGGFEANVQMRTQHIGPLVGGAKVRGTPHNQGDGLRMAMAIGAMPWGQWSGCHATPISADWGNFAPRELTDRSNRLSYLYGVMINRRGHRFVDEGEDGAMFTTPSTAALSSPNPAPRPTRSSTPRSSTCSSRATPPASRSRPTRWRTSSPSSTSTTRRRRSARCTSTTQPRSTPTTASTPPRRTGSPPAASRLRRPTGRPSSKSRPTTPTPPPAASPSPSAACVWTRTPR